MTARRSPMDVFCEAVQRPGAEREAYLAEACAGDEALLAEVRGLLRTLSQAGDFLADPAPGLPPTQISASIETPGATVGRYKLLQQIGEGGFGVVFLAEQREPVVRRVALKVIKLGMDTRAVIARFEAERQALAMMDHPNIARVLDAGATESGRPYFVMELVRGVPITEYCDANDLAIEERLRLFQQVCHAVQHAHQKGIIHRDLKPFNVLVTSTDDKPVPKVIDFGIAKATSARLTEKTLFTEHRQLIGTPEYMSPEQADTTAGDIDTRSDVYSLGVLLYELLTGVLPYDPKRLRSAAFGEIQRIIREEEPPKPSTRLSTLEGLPGIAAHRHVEPARLTRMVRGDLDWIVMKALEKDRTRRYETADGLALDVQRHLAREPVIAAPPSAAYRIHKFARRNKGPVAAVAAVTLTLVLGLTASIIGFVSATRNAQTATAATALARDEAARATEEATRARTAERAAEQAAYVSHITAADASLRVNEIAGVRASLDACPEHLRNWEWRYFNAQADTSLLVLRGHSGGATSIAFSPDGTRIVAGSHVRTAKVWDASNGTPLAVLRGHDEMIRAVAFSPDGARIVTACADHIVRVWDAGSGAMTALMRGHRGEVFSAEFNRDGARILTTARDGTARIWDARTGSELAVLSYLEERTETGITAHFSPDDSHIVTTSTGRLAVIWDASTGRRLSVLRGHGGGVYDAVFSPDSRRIVTASTDATARIWDAQTGAQILILTGHQGPVLEACFSPDGTRILTRSLDRSARVWHAATGAQVSVMSGREDGFLFARFAPDNARVLTVSSDRTARLWDAARGDQLVVWRGHGDRVNDVVFSPDGSRIATASEDGTVRVWDAAMRPAILSENAMIGVTVGFSPDSSRIVTDWIDSRGCYARIWDAATGAQLATLGHTPPLTWAGFSPDGSRLVTTGIDSNARVWDIVTGALLLTLSGHGGIVCSASFSPDGTRIATASVDKTARIWDAASGTSLHILAGHDSLVSRVSFSPDSTKLATASHDKTARVWDAAAGSEIIVLRGHTLALYDASFSPDGARIVTASGDNTARVWDAAAGTLVAVLSGHNGPVATAAFSPDGTRIVTASDDRTARLWDPKAGTQVAVLRGHADGLRSAVFSGDGARIATTSPDQTVRIWDTAPYTQRYKERRAATAAEPVARQVLDAALGPSRDYTKAASIIRADTSLPDPIPRLAFNLLLVRADADRAALHQRANVVVSEVRSRLLFAADTRAAIEAETSLAADLHAECRRVAEALPRDRPDLLNRCAWAIVRVAGGTSESYAIALRGAEAAVRDAPEIGNYVNTLGVALYRNGRFTEALAALLRSDAINATSGIGPLPADAAFLAMTQFRLGHEDEARAALARLRELMNDPTLAADEENWAFVREAESVIGPLRP